MIETEIINAAAVACSQHPTAIHRVSTHSYIAAKAAPQVHYSVFDCFLQAGFPKDT